jgi:hypothetical protein
MPDQFSRPCYAYGRPGGSGRILVLYLEYTELASQDSSEIVSLRSSRLDSTTMDGNGDPSRGYAGVDAGLVHVRAYDVQNNGMASCPGCLKKQVCIIKRTVHPTT